MIENLNEKQLKAVKTNDKNLLIIAGPGSGKTKTIINKIAYLIDSGTDPKRILGLTFTNKAAKEMKIRLSKLAGNNSSKVNLSTFHSFALRMLKIYPLKAFGRDFTIYDERDSISVVKSIVKNLNIDKTNYKEIVSLISLIKDEMIDMEKEVKDIEIKKIFEGYQKELTKARAMDFGDLILNLIKKTYEDDFGEFISNKYKYIIVDEFQDTNVAQYRLLKCISKNSTVTVVGDEDQSIYGWRGAEIENILNFPKEFNAEVINLDINYRSAKKIVEYSQNLIKHNSLRYDKKIKAKQQVEGSVNIFDFNSDREEARFVAMKVKELLRNNVNPEEIAVFYRTNSQSKLIEDFFSGASIPYYIVGDISFYQRKEVKDIIYFIRLIVNNNDLEALKRIINIPPRGIGTSTVEIILNSVSSDKGIKDFMDTLLFNPSLSASKKYKIMEFWSNIQKLKDFNITKFRKFLDDIKYFEYIRLEDRKYETNKIENVEKLLKELEDIENISEWLNYASLMTSSENKSSNAVSLMTLHSCKGLEFEYCFITGAVDGLIPNIRDSLYTTYNEIFKREDKAELKEYEEERRLFYVGITRAKKEVYITHSRKRMINGKISNTIPSPFLSELSIKQENYQQNIFKNKRNPVKTKTVEKSIELKNFGFKKGMVVEHPSYGKGEILATVSSVDDQKLVVYFPGVGKKVLSGALAPLKRI